MNRPTLWLRVVLWLALFGWAATIVYFSSLPGPEIAEIMPFQMWDKFLHFSAFTVGGMLFVGALRANTAWSWQRIALVCVAVLALFGAIDEWHQLHTPNRFGADVFDWLADALGSFSGVAVYRLAGLWMRKRPIASPSAQLPETP